MVIAIRSLDALKSVQVARGVFNTANGNMQVFGGMSPSPQLAFLVPTRLTSTAMSTSDTSGSFGFGVAVNNNGTIQQASIAATTQDNVATSVAKSQTNNSNLLTVLDNTGNTQLVGAVTAFTDSIQISQTQSPASGLEFAALGFGAQLASGLIVPDYAGMIARVQRNH
jgi:hypothetical protein